LLSNHHGHHQFDDFVYDDYYDDAQNSTHKHKHKHHHNKKKKKTKPKPGAANKPPKNKPNHKHKKKHKPKSKPKEEDDDYKDFFQGFPLNGMGDPVGRSLSKRSLLSRSKFYEIMNHRFEL